MGAGNGLARRRPTKSRDRIACPEAEGGPSQDVPRLDGPGGGPASQVTCKCEKRGAAAMSLCFPTIVFFPIRSTGTRMTALDKAVMAQKTYQRLKLWRLTFLILKFPLAVVLLILGSVVARYLECLVGKMQLAR